MTSVTRSKDEAAAYDAAQRVVETHRRLSSFLRVGMRLPEIDAFVGKTLDDLGCKSCFYRYSPGRMPPFPSQACLSVNDCVVHGTAGYYPKPLQRGDLLKIDIGVWYRGWIGDAAWTYSFGEPEGRVKDLLDAGKRGLELGIQQLRPGNRWIEWARALQDHVEGECGLHLVRGLGGHGIGRKLHAAPWISNVVPSFPGEWADANVEIRPGAIVAVEPMLAVGTGRTKNARNAWPIYSADGSMTAHFEHDVYVADDGPRILSEGLEQVPDIIEA